MNYLTPLKEHLRLSRRSRQGTKLSEAKIVGCYLKLFPTEGLSDKIKSAGFVSEVRPCQEHKVSVTTTNFLLRRKNGPIKPEMFYIRCDCYYLNEAQTRPGPKHNLFYRAQDLPSDRVRPRPESQAQAHADL
jgi:hypothetical protein